MTTALAELSQKAKLRSSATSLSRLPDKLNLWRIPPFGADGGYGTSGDALPRVTQTADNVDLNVIWSDAQAAMNVWNAHRTALVDLLSYWHTSAGDAVGIGPLESQFEEASEFGEPQGNRPSNKYWTAGYDFRDYDLATRFTWQALRDMDSRQVRAATDEALNSDNKLVTGTILDRLLSPVPQTNSFGLTCYGLWTGDDGLTPPDWNGHSFQSSHSHYQASGNTTLDSADIEDAVRHIREHGRGLLDSSETLIALVNETESELIQSWRAGAVSANSAKAKWDFIPAVNQPSFILENAGTMVGAQPSPTVHNLPRVGSYGPVSIVESQMVPEGYVIVVATGGPGSPSNPVGVRQHTVADYQGLRLLPGNQTGYPLIEAFHTRSFGTGIKNRSAALVYQLTASPNYTAPAVPR